MKEYCFNRAVNYIAKHNQLFLWSFALFGILLRVLFIFIWDGRTTPDSFNYIAQAEAILNGNPVSSFPNGYPMLIVLTILIGGKSLLYFLLIAINFIAQILSGVILYKTAMEIGRSFYVLSLFNNKFKITLEVFSRLFALAVLFLFAIYPTQIYFTNMVLTESITTLFLTLTVYLFISKKYFTSGIALAVAAAVRTTFLPALLLIFMFLFLNEKSGLKKFTLGAGLIILFLGVLNFIGITKFPVNQSYNLLIAINGMSSSINHDLRNFTSEEIKQPAKTYINFAFNKPVEFTKQRLNAFYELWGPYPFEIKNKFIKIIFGIRFGLFLSWIISLILLLKKCIRNRNVLLVSYLMTTSVFILVSTIIHSVYFSSFRFIVPIEPVMIPMLLLSAFFYLDKLPFAKSTEIS
ncbi:MAG: hypothetical protein M0P61_04185 [Ignavibacteriaceae bacterium]|jgi:hypothetical protein|nr:hypothetical protein [Ignavibacteriaceae bacterium]